jgi:hypothetical protein
MEMNTSLDELRRRLELALRPAEPPTVEEVLAAVERNGRLHGPADWVFPAWRLYVGYVVKEIVDRFKLSAEEEDQLKDFGRKLDTLLGQAEKRAKAKLTSIHNAIVNNRFRIERNRLYAEDGTWIHIKATPRFRINGVSAAAYFPDVLKLSPKKLELFQMGWRASDEGNDSGQPVMGTAQPWQLFAWLAVRYGRLRIHVASVNVTHEGVSILMHIWARSWKQQWNTKNEAIDLVASHFKRGEWTPMLTMWLGDGESKRREILRGRYVLVIATKEPWRLGSSKSAYEAVVAKGREAFEKLREAASIYGELLDLLRAHKWIDVKLVTEYIFRTTYRLRTKRRSIDVLRGEAYRQNSVETSVGQLNRKKRGNGLRSGVVVVTGVEMSLHLVSGKGGSLLAERYTRDVGEALAAAERLESAGLRPNVVRSGPYYVVYIATADLLKLAERDGEIRRAIALYLADKAKDGTPRQRELAEKILRRHPFFNSRFTVSSTDRLTSLALCCMKSISTSD